MRGFPKNIKLDVPIIWPYDRLVRNSLQLIKTVNHLSRYIKNNTAELSGGDRLTQDSKDTR